MQAAATYFQEGMQGSREEDAYLGMGQEWKDCQAGSRREEVEWRPLTKTLSVES